MEPTRRRRLRRPSRTVEILGDVEQHNTELEAVLRALPDGVLIIDARGALKLANQRAEDLLGATRQEIARSFRDGTSLFGKALRESDFRVELERSPGDRLVLEGQTVPVLHPDGGVVAVVVAFRDVAARDGRDRAERNFIANAAHELQTPLASITSAIAVLEAGAKERVEERDRFLAYIARACKRLDRLTRALLVLARAQTGDEAPRKELIPVEPLLRNVAGSFAEEREIEIACEEDVAVLTNRVLLEQAVANLGQNALKHTSGNVVLGAERNDGHVTIAVRDSGPGISESDQARVFDRFYRGDGSAQDEGFGLGLAIVEEAVRALGGELNLETSSAGTTVGITLPAARLVAR